MKSLLLVCFAAGALATPTINAKYVAYSTTTQNCVVKPGYVFAANDDVALGMQVAAQPLFTVPTTLPVADGTACTYTTDAQVVQLYCAAGYSASGASPATLTGAYALSSAATWVITTMFFNTSSENAYQFNTDTDFTCTAIPAPSCAYTCTPASACLLGTNGTVVVGTNGTALCTPGHVPTSSTQQCAVAGNTLAVTCTSDPRLAAPEYYLLLASFYNAYSIPGTRCTCDVDPICPTTTEAAIQPACTKCNLACTSRAIATSAAFCPFAVTVAQAWQCFEIAACAGAIVKTDTCVFGALGGLTTACPGCPSGSKKGLLGLLGLLGLIPLLLCCSLLCGLWSCCIRRKKAGGDVHFATFDAGAPSVACAPPVVGTHLGGFAC